MVPFSIHVPQRVTTRAFTPDDLNNDFLYMSVADKLSSSLPHSSFPLSF